MKSINTPTLKAPKNMKMIPKIVHTSKTNEPTRNNFIMSESNKKQKTIEGWFDPDEAIVITCTAPVNMAGTQWKLHFEISFISFQLEKNKKKS